MPVPLEVMLAQKEMQQQKLNAFNQVTRKADGDEEAAEEPKGEAEAPAEEPEKTLEKAEETAEAAAAAKDVKPPKVNFFSKMMQSVRGLTSKIGSKTKAAKGAMKDVENLKDAAEDAAEVAEGAADVADAVEDIKGDE